MIPSKKRLRQSSVEPQSHSNIMNIKMSLPQVHKGGGYRGVSESSSQPKILNVNHSLKNIPPEIIIDQDNNYRDYARAYSGMETQSGNDADTEGISHKEFTTP